MAGAPQNVTRRAARAGARRQPPKQSAERRTTGLRLLSQLPGHFHRGHALTAAQNVLAARRTTRLVLI